MVVAGSRLAARDAAEANEQWNENTAEDDHHQHCAPGVEECPGRGAERDEEHRDRDQLEHEDVLVEPFEIEDRRAGLLDLEEEGILLSCHEEQHPA